MGTTTSSPPTSYIEPWLVGDTSVSLTDASSNYFDSSLSVSNTIGSKVVDPVDVKLFDKNCDTLETGTAVVSILNLVPTPATFGYEVKVDQSKIGNTDSTYVTCIAGANAACAEGTIEFCTRVSTFHGSIEVAFRETNFALSFNLTENGFELGNINIEENDPDSFITDVDTEYTVGICQCDSTGTCVSPSTIEQDENLVICLEPEHPTDASNVEITNFNIEIAPSTAVAGFTSYKPVWFGSDSWVSDALTDVTVLGDTVKISTPIIAQFFIQNVGSVEVSGNAFLEFKSAKGEAPVFTKYAIIVALAEGVEVGCLAGLIRRIRSTF